MPILETFALLAEEEAGSAIVADAMGSEAGLSAYEASLPAESAFAPSAAQAAGTYAALSPAQEAYLQASQAGLEGITQGVKPLPPAGPPPAIPAVTNAAAQMGATTVPESVIPGHGLTGATLDPSAVTSAAQMTPQVYSGPGISEQMGQWWKGLSPFEKGMTAYAGATGLARLGAFGYGGTPSPFQPYSGSAYKISPNFQPRIADPTQFQYTPRRYAEGGIASVPGYAKGGNLSDSMDYYKMMVGQQGDTSEHRRAPSAGIDTGIYYDTDPDTQRADALTAAQIRMAKVNKRTGMQGQGMTRPQGLGQLNLTPIGTKAGQEVQYRDLEAAQGGIMQAYAGGGPVEQMSNANAVGANTGFPMANIQRGAYATPYQQPISQNVITGAQDGRVDPYTGEEKLAMGGGISSLGGYAAGGNPRLLKGPGDGMSDNIPAMIGGRQPARLADGEFVVPADVVSHLGNGSTDAGAKKLDHMMSKVRKARTGNPKQGKQINPDKYMPK